MNLPLKLTLVLCLYCFPCALYSQSYESLLSEDTIQWNYLTEYGMADMLYTMRYKAYGDTLIGGENYRKLAFSSYPLDKGLFGFLREEPDAGKVWLLRKDDVSEMLIMDMDLQLNDTFNFTHPGSVFKDMDFIVADISYEDNRKVLELQSSSTYLDLVFREGLGTDLMFHSIFESTYSDLLCISKANVLLYSNPAFASCDTTIFGSIHGVKVFSAVLGPNPVKDRLYCSMPDSAVPIKEVLVYDSSGRVVIIRSGISMSRVELDVTELAPGSYYLRMNGLYFGKFIKTD